MKALIVGATGLVGRELVKTLLQTKYYNKVNIVVRKKLSIVHPRLEQYRMTFEEWDELSSDMFYQTDVYCTLGTTRKKAGSKENFRLVDYEYVLKMAQLAKKYQAKKFIVVTAMGADIKSLFFYNRVKGELEQALIELQLPQLIIIRPSLILGDRYEHRFGEQFAAKLYTWFSFAFKGKMEKYKPVHAKRIADAMYKLAILSKEKQAVIQSNQIEYWAKKKQKGKT